MELDTLDHVVKWSVRQVSSVKRELIMIYKKGTWGEGCTNVCQCNWSNTESCDPVNGQCVCKNGFTGDECSQGQFQRFFAFLSFFAQTALRVNGDPVASINVAVVVIHAIV